MQDDDAGYFRREIERNKQHCEISRDDSVVDIIDVNMKMSTVSLRETGNGLYEVP